MYLNLISTACGYLSVNNGFAVITWAWIMLHFNFAYIQAMRFISFKKMTCSFLGNNCSIIVNNIIITLYINIWELSNLFYIEQQSNRQVSIEIEIAKEIAIIPVRPTDSLFNRIHWKEMEILKRDKIRKHIHGNLSDRKSQFSLLSLLFFFFLFF